MTASQDIKARYDEIVAEARRLRIGREQRDTEFLLYLNSIHKTEMALLSNMGHPTFASFLKDTELIEPSRYANFAAGVDLVGEKTARDLGAASVIALANATSRAAATEVCRVMYQWQEQHGGVRPSLQTAKRILRQVDPRKEVPRAAKAATEQQRLQAENARLKSELATVRSDLIRVTRERDILKDRVVDLSKQITALQKPSGKRSR
jgi:hypothetical protein